MYFTKDKGNIAIHYTLYDGFGTFSVKDISTEFTVFDCELRSNLCCESHNFYL
jgi:hypothetical protein